MIPFTHTGKTVPSLEEKATAENYFTNELLGNFKEEFEKKGGYVSVDHNEPVERGNRYLFSLSSEYSLGKFIDRVNKSKKDGQQKI